MDTKLNHKSRQEYYKITQDIKYKVGKIILSVTQKPVYFSLCGQLHIYYIKEDEEKIKCKDEEQTHTKSLQAKDEGVKANTPVNYPSLKQQVPHGHVEAVTQAEEKIKKCFKKNNQTHQKKALCTGIKSDFFSHSLLSRD